MNKIRRINIIYNGYGGLAVRFERNDFIVRYYYLVPHTKRIKTLASIFTRNSLDWIRDFTFNSYGEITMTLISPKYELD